MIFFPIEEGTIISNVFLQLVSKEFELQKCLNKWLNRLGCANKAAEIADYSKYESHHTLR